MAEDTKTNDAYHEAYCFPAAACLSTGACEGLFTDHIIRAQHPLAQGFQKDSQAKWRGFLL
jgi:hypothetical protein